VHRGLTSLVERFAEYVHCYGGAATKVEERRNVDCLRLIFAAAARGDFDTVFAGLTDDTEYVIFASGEVPFQMHAHGRGEVQAGMRHNFTSVDFEGIDVDTLVAEGDQVVFIARQRGRWLASGVAFDERIVLEYTFRDGLVSRYRGWILPGAP
jgi:ketosteroid isomerase-like protein